MTRAAELTDVADANPAVLPGLIWAFRIHADGTAEPLPTGTPIDMHHDGWLWLHFNLADARAVPLLNAFLGLPPAARQVLTAAEAHQQLQVDEAAVYGVFADLIYGLDGATREIGFLHFALTERLLVSARRHAMTAAESARQALLSGHKLTSVAALLEMIVRRVIGSIDAFADRLAEEMDAIEVELLSREVGDERQQLIRIRKSAVHLHRQLAGLYALFQRCGKDLDSSVQPQLRLPAGALQQRLQGLDHDIVALRDRAQLLQEEAASKVAEQTNRSLHYLTVITTYFLPANLVAGIFGMNVKGLPLTDQESGFFWAMLLLLASPLVISILMWRMRGR